MSIPLNILIVEDVPDDAELLLAALRRAGFAPRSTRVDTAPDFLAELEKLPDIIISDYSMPQFNGLKALELLQQKGLNIPFVLVSGTVGEDIAVEAMKRGATDYLLKDRMGRLGSAVERALEQHRLRAERQRTEADLNLFRTLIDRTTDSIEVVDPETGRFLDVNETACQKLGYSREELLALSVPDIEAVAVDHSSWSKLVEEIRQTGFKIIEGRLKRKDGSTFPVEVNVRHVQLDREYLIAVVRDITERKQAEEGLRASEGRLRLVTDNARVGLVMIDENHCYTFVNATYIAILGLPSPDLIGRRVADVLAPLYEEQIRPRLDAAFAGERVAYELHQSGSGGERYYAVRYEPMKIGAAVSLVVVVITEMTEQRQAETEIKNQLNELQRWHDAMLGREERILELKSEVNELLTARQMPQRYSETNLP